MKGYVFISNSTKPNIEKANSRKKLYPSNVSRPCLEAALALGYEVFWGVNRNHPEELECDLPVKMFDSHTYRSLTALKDNWIAFRNLSTVLRENDIEVIHCNTPIGGIIGRLCGRLYKVKTVIYTAHGFHFYKGAPIINNTLFKWAEMLMAHFTDVIITMNEEDYVNAQKFHLRNGGSVYKVHGVGININDYENIIIDRNTKRAELGLKESDVVCISAGDLIPRKNYGVAIEAIAKVNSPNLHYLICGTGPEKEKLQSQATHLGIAGQIHFLGFRTDIKELLAVSDIFLLTSLQEGLPRSLMEAMASGLPCVVSKIRGNIDLINNNGMIIPANDVVGFANALVTLGNDKSLAKKYACESKAKIKNFDVINVKREIFDIYQNELKEI